ncbi:hypothetical protein CHS0354_004706 [Potamilus streckersoni]|uniref:ABC transporter domain-containing protein n=1 Tax=Potamilus streckersoni TaxID=2493646 RepID=A0AAE0W6M8_9BIVA|nr:hypothetical protein CHS0354_004706 [Potamilus streckersoni]
MASNQDKEIQVESEGNRIERDKTGFFHQLRLLLWKNFTIKRRSPFVLLFELVTPLVLFMILLLVRRNQEAFKIKEYHFKPMPLPTAGIIPLMKSMCSVQTENYHDQRLTELLIHLDDIAHVIQKCKFGNSVQCDSSNISEKLVLSLLKLDSYFGKDLKENFDSTLNTNSEAIHLDNNVSEQVQNSSSTRVKQRPLDRLLDIWRSVQPYICGEGNSSSANSTGKLHLESSTQEHLEILTHIFYSNPKILYAPNNTATNQIIAKLNETMELIGNLTYVAKMWLHASGKMRQSVANIDFVSIQQIFATILPGSFTENLKSSFTDVIVSILDRGARGWLSFVDGINLDVFKGFKTERELQDYFLKKQQANNISVIAGIIFDNLSNRSELPPHVIYRIRQNASFTPPTQKIRDLFWFPSPGDNHLRYYYFGFIWIQDLVDRAIIDLQVGRSVVEPGNFLHRMPYPCWLWDQFIWLIQHVVPLCFMLAWVYAVAMLVHSIVYEKEHRLKEVMKVMGLSNTVHWCAWLISSFMQMTLTSIVLTLMLKFGKILPHSNIGIIFIFLEAFVTSSIAFSFLISSCFSKARIAAAWAGIIYFVAYVPYIYVSIKEEVTGILLTTTVKIVTSLFSTSAFGLGGKYFLFYEIEGSGVQWETLNWSPLEGDTFSLMYIILMMCLDTVLYLLIAWYIDNVHPGSYGLPKPWYFPLLKSYWLTGHVDVQTKSCANLICACCQKCASKREGLSIIEENQACAMNLQSTEDGNIGFEVEPIHLKQSVQIKHLTKIHSKNERPAVDRLSLNLYEGQILALLGHNGAGKTTTMSILTGLYPPSSGYATIYGLDIRTDMDAIRQSLGMCPQHSVLFNKLTVAEHLWFYARLKGMKMADIRKESERMLSDLDLEKKRNSLTDTLSGGMRRKLSVAVAFVGGAKTVILDEPTAGVDPFSRRAIWKILSKYKKGRTILISTHHMDEAEVLGDRIAIISSGRLACLGSPSFLQNTFGGGCKLHVLKIRREHIHSQSTMERINRAENQSTCKLTLTIKAHVSNARVISESTEEIHYALGKDNKLLPILADLFEVLENDLETFNIQSYGITESTIEDVFLNVTAKCMKGNKGEEVNEIDYVESTDGSGEKSLSHPIPEDNHGVGIDVSHSSQSMSCNDECTGIKRDGDIDSASIPNPTLVQPEQRKRLFLTLNHLRAILVKRFRYATRNIKGIFSQIILPTIFVSIAMTVALSAPKEEDPPRFELSTSQYAKALKPKGNYVPYSNEHSSNRSLEYLLDAGPEDIINTFSYPSGIGATCLLKSPWMNETQIGVVVNSTVYFILLEEYFSNGCDSVFEKETYATHYPKFSKRKNWSDVKISSINESDIKDVKEIVQYYPDCSCRDDNSGFLCYKERHALPPERVVVTGDKLLNITGTNTEKYLLNTADEFKLHRYGGFSFGTEEAYVPERFNYPPIDWLKKIAVRGSSNVWFNQKGFHSMPTYLNALNNAILRANLPRNKDNPAAYGITTYNHPMDGTNDIMESDYIQGGTDVLMAIFIIVAMSFVPASFVVFLVYERSIGAKHMQFVFGVNPTIYWAANYVWDMLNYLVPVTCIIIILFAFHIPAYVEGDNFKGVLALFIIYGWSITPMMYPLSFLFREPSVAYIVLIIINLFTGITCVISSFILKLFNFDQGLDGAYKVIADMFLVFPNYCLGEGLMAIAYNHYLNTFYSHTDNMDKIRSPLEWDIVVKKLVVMSVTGVIFFVFTVLCEYKSFSMAKCQRKIMNHRSQEDLDEDVAFERRRIVSECGQNDLLRVVSLSKEFKSRKRGKHKAVNDLSFGISAGQCFGLLGVNGAGKTTTFRMITGEEKPSAGNVYVKGQSVLSSLHSCHEHQSIGYCPQYDALFAELTGREHLQLYGRLRGIPPKDENKDVVHSLEKLGLLEYADKQSKVYSGGTKRKLSTAIALIGDPQVLLMDEPTTGMDPHSKRFLWDFITDITKQGRAILLTSHSMEECETLCSRLSIMVNGQLKCIGSSQHLKNKYGCGYTVTFRGLCKSLSSSISLSSSSSTSSGDGLSCLVDIIKRIFPDIKVKDLHEQFLRFEIQQVDIPIAKIFRFVDELRVAYSLQDCSITQNTLDHVFVNFVKQQMDDTQTSKIKGKCSKRETAEPPTYDDDLELLIPLHPSDCRDEDDSLLRDCV